MVSRYIIIGAGAIGGGLAGLLADAGVPVVAVARGAHAEAIQGRGLTVRTPDRSFTVRVPCVTGPEQVELSAEDVLVLSTKTHQAQAALRPWVDRPVCQDGQPVGTVAERLPVLTALNGVASEEIALRYLERVFGVCVWMPAVHLEPGEVIVRGTPLGGCFHIGPYPADAAGESGSEAVLQAVTRDWTAGGFQVLCPPDVMPWKYRKLISNLGNAFQALVGSNGSVQPLVTAAQQEGREVLRRAGIEVVDDETEAAARQDSFRVAPVPGEPTELGGSSWQSLARGTGSIETDYLNGEIVRIAHRHRLAAPINATLARLARQAAQTGARPGDLSADRLGELLGLTPAG